MKNDKCFLRCDMTKIPVVHVCGLACSALIRNCACFCGDKQTKETALILFCFWQLILAHKHGIVFRAARPTLNLFSLISFGHTHTPDLVFLAAKYVSKPLELTVLSAIDSNSKGNICGCVDICW